MQFKYKSSLHSSYLKPQTINMDVIPLDLLCLQKVSKHAIFGQNCNISNVHITYDSNLIDLQFVC